MRIRRLSLKNWMNYQRLDTGLLFDRTFVIGPNACGKSNLLEALRFLRDVALPAGKRPGGGGLQKAVGDRGGLTKVRCLNAKQDNEILLEVELEEAGTEGNTLWLYRLGFKGEGRANHRILITQEYAELNGKEVLNRPNANDAKDPDSKTQSYLELTTQNQPIRPLAHFFGETTYLHLVPQLLKFSNLIGGNTIENDPFGQGFLQRISGTAKVTRDARLRRIQKHLDAVVPQFKGLRFLKDEVSGQPHLEANIAHWRPNGAWQRETQFSDGTLRLIGLLWSLMEGSSLLLLEEPELSLNEEIVRHLPRLIQKIQKESKTTRQVIITTHSEAMLSDRSISAEEVIRLDPTEDGTQIRKTGPEEKIMLKSGLSVGEVFLPTIKPKAIGQLLINYA